MAGLSRWTDDEPDSADELHEINVTPFIDVMLVLLIIFMVAAPLATVDVPVDLPASNAPVEQRVDDPVYVTLGGDLQLSVQNIAVDRDGLGAELDRLSSGDREMRVFLRADQSVAYGELMELLNLVRNAGYTRIALVGMESRAVLVEPGAAGP